MQYCVCLMNVVHSVNISIAIEAVWHCQYQVVDTFTKELPFVDDRKVIISPLFQNASSNQHRQERAAVCSISRDYVWHGNDTICNKLIHPQQVDRVSQQKCSGLQQVVCFYRLDLLFDWTFPLKLGLWVSLWNQNLHTSQKCAWASTTKSLENGWICQKKLAIACWSVNWLPLAHFVRRLVQFIDFNLIRKLQVRI